MKTAAIFSTPSWKKMFYYGLAYMFFHFSTHRIEAQVLNAGDFAVIGINASYNISGANPPFGPDEFAIVALADISSGTVIKITDRGWNGSALISANTADGALSWTITNDIPYGTVFKFSISSGGSPSVAVVPVDYGVPVVIGGWTGASALGAMANVGDQVIIYQGNDATPSRFIYGFTTSSSTSRPNGEWQIGSTSARDSDLPPGLVNNVAMDGSVASSAMAFTAGYSAQNLVYVGTNTGDKATLLATIGTRDNWVYTSTSTSVYDLSPGGDNFPGNNPVFKIALPVSWIGFEGRRQSDEVILTWQTASEKNNHGFEIQQSADGGISYHTVAFVEGNGDSHRTITYEARVHNTEAAKYRLRQIDYDGADAYSPAVFVRGMTHSTVSIVPNPFSEKISLTGDAQQSYQIVLTDTYGRHLASYTGVLHQLETALNNTFATQKPGVYWLQIVGASEREVQQLIKAE
jgi:hypothetical protein